MKDSKACEGKCIEWTGAGGDYFLGIVVDREDEVIAEHWGAREEILAWMKTSWPQLPAKYVPMVYVPRGRRGAPKIHPPLRSKAHHAG